MLRHTRKSRSSGARLIAFYLPQFHPIPENDRWWGEGFTEWTNVVKGKPLFPGHYQPRLPGELGFYDLRLPEVRQAQADLAREYGIYGFCYYHYWFHGRQLLERPLSEVMATGQPDFPFCLCWANENWTRVWDGLDQEILIEQTHSEEDDRQHIRWLVQAFRHKNYIRIDGKPLFLVYRVSKLSDPLRSTSIWREEAQRMGIGEIYLAMVESHPGDRYDPTKKGFDAAVEFQPDWVRLGPPAHRTEEGSNIYDYSSVMERMLKKDRPSYQRFPCVTPGWDNTSRRLKEACVLRDSTPQLYRKWLEATIRKFRPSSEQENFVFINAWNEWGEAAYLEPCQKWGRAYLEATRNALRSTESGMPQFAPQPGPPSSPTPRVSVCIPTYNGAEHLRAAITSVLNQTVSDLELIVVDDCSTDSTEAVIESIEDSRLRYFKNPTHLGTVANWNKCVSLSSGPYVSFFQQDDIMMHTNLEEKIGILLENRNVGLVHSSVYQMSGNGNIAESPSSESDRNRDAIRPGPEYLQELMLAPAKQMMGLPNEAASRFTRGNGSSLEVSTNTSNAAK